MFYDIKLTAESVKALGEWVREEGADVEIAVDDRMLVASQGDEKMAWDTDGSPGSEEYIAMAPLDNPLDRGQQVYVVPGELSDDPAVFWREVDASAYAATFSESRRVDKLIICGPELAARMIAERTDEEEVEGFPYVVGISEPRIVLCRFETEEEAKTFSALLEPSEDYDYFLAGPEDAS